MDATLVSALLQLSTSQVKVAWLAVTRVSMPVQRPLTSQEGPEGRLFHLPVLSVTTFPRSSGRVIILSGLGGALAGDQILC